MYMLKSLTNRGRATLAVVIFLAMWCFAHLMTGCAAMPGEPGYMPPTPEQAELYTFVAGGIALRAIEQDTHELAALSKYLHDSISFVEEGGPGELLWFYNDFSAGIREPYRSIGDVAVLILTERLNVTPRTVRAEVAKPYVIAVLSGLLRAVNGRIKERTA